MKQRNLMITLGVAAAILAMACGGTPKSSGSGSQGGSPAVAAKDAGLNQPVRDGKFEFVVTKVQCGVSQVGTSTLNKKAQGQFCKISMSVKNIGTEAQLFDASSQQAYNATGVKYDADGEAGIYLGDSSNAFLNNINPGNTVSGIVIFDIPKTEKIAKLELHDSAFSGGVSVKVT